MIEPSRGRKQIRSLSPTRLSKSKFKVEIAVFAPHLHHRASGSRVVAKGAQACPRRPNQRLCRSTVRQKLLDAPGVHVVCEMIGQADCLCASFEQLGQSEAFGSARGRRESTPRCGRRWSRARGACQFAHATFHERVRAPLHSHWQAPPGCADPGDQSTSIGAVENSCPRSPQCS